MGYIPLNQPYNTDPWDYQGSESVVSIPIKVVDWVLVDILIPYGTGNNLSFELLSRKAGFITEDGKITDLGGINDITFQFPTQGFHIRIQHKKYLSKALH